jgi:preprotein translocase subunit SecA
MLNKLIEALFGSKTEKDLQGLLPILHAVNRKEAWAKGLAPEQYIETTAQLKKRHAEGESLDDLLPEAFALVREAARRMLGERLYDVQILGGIVLHQGRIMEMKTGEGKTVSSVTAAYLNALSGRGVHIVTVNDYLAGRDAEWMSPVYNYLGVSVGSVLSEMDNDARKQAYACDITYGTNNEFGFDYLRDNMRFDSGRRVQRAHNFVIVDEIDSILIDEARTPLIISGAAEDDTRKYVEVNRVVPELVECEKDPETGEYPEEPEGDYKVEEKSKRVSFTDEGLNHLEEILRKRQVISGSLFDSENFEYIHHVTQAMKAHHLFRRDTDYVVKEGQVQIVDEFTGRILYGRRYSDGLHQAIEAKEGIRVAQRNRTLATITFQNFFRMYDKLAGMTGTAETEAKEFGKIYGLDVVVIPTNRPLARADMDDVIYLNESDKYQAIGDEIKEVNERGQPILIGTASIERSETLSDVLTRRGIRHEILNAKNHAREALIIAEAGAKGSVTIATNMAGRGTDIKLGGNPEFRARKQVGTQASDEDFSRALSEETEKWRAQYEEVKELGGLYVLGTERHESRRIDNQLRGRSGRQGDPGHSQFYLSMDDDLMRLFGGGRANLKSLMERVGMTAGEPINSPLINKSIERAQSRVEERNFEIRKHLLEYDDVLNEQRKFIYEQRDAILDDRSIKDRILATASDVLTDALSDFQPDRSDSREAIAGVLTHVRDRLYFGADVEETSLLGLDAEALKARLLELMRKDLDEKEETAGADAFNIALRFEYLRNIDQRWQDHLENLEALREAVYLRAYGQKNPLLEYKLEGFQIFDQLLEDIRVAIARKVFLVKAEGFRPAPAGPRPMTAMQARHTQLATFEGGNESRKPAAAAGPRGRAAPAAGAGRGGSAQAGAQVTRSIPKVGRNEPCPCGSGKKYKHCHGR